LGADEVPEWYTSALNDPERLKALEGAAPLAAALPAEPVAAEPEPEPELEQAMPDWLRGAAPTGMLGPIGEEVPDWLTEEIPAAEQEQPAEIDWLAEPAARPRNSWTRS
jgi:hypothetical protein